MDFADLIYLFKFFLIIRLFLPLSLSLSLALSVVCLSVSLSLSLSLANLYVAALCIDFKLRVNKQQKKQPKYKFQS